MAKSEERSPVSNSRTYREMGEFWDEHDLAQELEEWKPMKFEIDLRGESIYFPVESSLAADLERVARARGVSAETLINLWVQEKVKNFKRMKGRRAKKAAGSVRSRNKSGELRDV